VDASTAADTQREHASVAEVSYGGSAIATRAQPFAPRLPRPTASRRRRTIATNEGNSTFNGFKLSVENYLADNRTQFVEKLNAASDRLRGLRLAMIVLPLLAAALALWVCNPMERIR